MHKRTEDLIARRVGRFRRYCEQMVLMGAFSPFFEESFTGIMNVEEVSVAGDMKIFKILEEDCGKRQARLEREPVAVAGRGRNDYSSGELELSVVDRVKANLEANQRRADFALIDGDGEDKR